MTLDDPNRDGGTVDDRGRRAAAGLRHSVERQIDAEGALTGLTGRRRVGRLGGPVRPLGPTRSGLTHPAMAGRSGRRLLAAAVVLVAIGIIGLAVVQAPSSRLAVDTDRDGERLGRLLPSSPIDGKESMRLPVLAEPQAGLADGDAIVVAGQGFEPGEQVGVLMCSSEADTQAGGVAGCDVAGTGMGGSATSDPPGTPGTSASDPTTSMPAPSTPATSGPASSTSTTSAPTTSTSTPSTSTPSAPTTSAPATAAPAPSGGIVPGGATTTSQVGPDKAGLPPANPNEAPMTFDRVTYTNAQPSGLASSTFKVRRFINTPGFGRIDCASAAERCIVAMGAVSDYDRSGGTYVNFAAAPPFPEPRAAVTPSKDLAPGGSVTVEASGLIADRQVQVRQCVAKRCAVLGAAKVSGYGTVRFDVKVFPQVRDGSGEVACDDRCTVAVDGIGVIGASSAPMPGQLDIRFDPAAAAEVPDPSRTTSTTTTMPMPSTTSVDGSVPPEKDVLIINGTTSTSAPSPPISETTITEPFVPGPITTVVGH